MTAKTQRLEPSSTAFPRHEQGVGWEAQQTEHEPALADRGLTYCAIAPSSNLANLSCVFSMYQTLSLVYQPHKDIKDSKQATIDFVSVIIHYSLTDV